MTKDLGSKKRKMWPLAACVLSTGQETPGAARRQGRRSDALRRGRRKAVYGEGPAFAACRRQALRRKRGRFPLPLRRTAHQEIEGCYGFSGYPNSFEPFLYPSCPILAGCFVGAARVILVVGSSGCFIRPH